jgi:hypothetical protein
MNDAKKKDPDFRFKFLIAAIPWALLFFGGSSMDPRLWRCLVWMGCCFVMNLMDNESLGLWFWIGLIGGWFASSPGGCGRFDPLQEWGM